MTWREFFHQRPLLLHFHEKRHGGLSLLWQDIFLFLRICGGNFFVVPIIYTLLIFSLFHLPLLLLLKRRSRFSRSFSFCSFKKIENATVAPPTPAVDETVHLNLECKLRVARQWFIVAAAVYGPIIGGNLFGSQSVTAAEEQQLNKFRN